MRKRLVAAVLMALAAGCTGKADTGNGQSEDSGARSAGNAWSLNRETTGIDGEAISASKTFLFEDRQTSFLVNVTCVTDKKVPRMSIESFVGDPENPDERSAFASAVGYNGLTYDQQPTGRVKIGNEETFGLGILFSVDKSFSNKIVMNGVYSRTKMQFPMVIEANTGSGSFEINVDASSEVMQVVSACGLQKGVSNASAPPVSSQRSLSGEDPNANRVIESPSSNASTTDESSPQSISPSFDCKKAATNTEMLICSDPTLAKLDNAMADNYAAIAASDIGDGAEKDLKSTQREWLKARDECADKDCLASMYRDRLDAVCDYPVISGVHPACTYSDEIK